MSELFDKVSAQKESLKNVWYSHKLPHAHEKMSSENERKKQRKNDVCVKIKEALYRVHTKGDGFSSIGAQTGAIKLAMAGILRINGTDFLQCRVTNSI